MYSLPGNSSGVMKLHCNQGVPAVTAQPTGKGRSCFLKMTPFKSSHRAAFTHRQKHNHPHGCRNILIPTLNISPKLILNDLLQNIITFLERLCHFYTLVLIHLALAGAVVAVECVSVYGLRAVREGIIAHSPSDILWSNKLQRR